MSCHVVSCREFGVFGVSCSGCFVNISFVYPLSKGRLSPAKWVGVSPTELDVTGPAMSERHPAGVYRDAARVASSCSYILGFF